MNNLIIILISLLFSAFFSGMEIAYVSSNKLRIELNKKPSTTSRIIEFFLNHPGQYIATMLVGNNISLVIYGIVMGEVLVSHFIPSFITSETTILIIQTVISTFIILITAEFLPKTLFRINPSGALNVFAWPVAFFGLIFYPISAVAIILSNGILSNILKVDIKEKPEDKVFTKIDLDNLITEGQQNNDDEGEIDIKIFQNALDFSNVKLRECMVPRTDIEALEINESIETLKQKFIETGFSKILIYKENIDTIVGYFNFADLFKNPKSIQSKLIAVDIVPESMPANNLLETFINDKKTVAIVVDEFGGTSGMVTIEDILEEIFGEIQDEHDNDDLIDKQIKDNLFLFSGRVEIDHINDKYHLNIETSQEYETLAGFILFHHGSIPKLNDSIEVLNLKIKILEVTDNRIDLVNLKLTDTK